MPICPFPDRWGGECCHANHCRTFQRGYVYGLLDARIGDIFYVGSTIKRPGVRYSQHMRASYAGNLREAWILSILADGSIPVLLSLGEFPTECELELKSIERALADELRTMGHTAMCDFTRPALQQYRNLCPINPWSDVYGNWKEHAIAEYLDRVNEQARIQRWLQEMFST